MKHKIEFEMIRQGVIAVVIFWIIILAVVCQNNKKGKWVIEDITYVARDGLEIRAYLLKPVIIRRAYPAVVCIHHAWGSRDDYLKLFPKLSSAGIIALSPDLVRHKPSFKKERYQDIIDSISYVKLLSYVDKDKTGIITSSLSVNTGAIALNYEMNVKAFVMLSGPIINEGQRKVLTRNTDLAIFAIISKYEGNVYHLMREYFARNANPLSRYLFLDNVEKKLKVEEHGTFLFDTHPEIVGLIGKFLIDAFGIKKISNGKIEKFPPLDTVEFNSTDKFPVYATYYSVRDNNKGVLLYPPRYKSRLYYERIGQKLKEEGVNVMIANNKRTCRYSDEEYLCDREIKGAVDFLIGNKGIKGDRIIGVFPAAYFIAIDRLLERKQMNLNKIILIGKPDANAYIDPLRLQSKFNNVIYIDSMDKNNLLKVLLQLIK